MPERERNGPPDEESLWLVFETAAANVESSKREQWLALAVTLVLDAGVVALFLALEPWGARDAALAAAAVVAAALAATYYIASCKVWIHGDRARMKWILENALSEAAREAWAQKKKYRDGVPLFRRRCADSTVFLVFAVWIAAAAVVYAVVRLYTAQV